MAPARNNILSRVRVPLGAWAMLGLGRKRTAVREGALIVELIWRRKKVGRNQRHGKAAEHTARVVLPQRDPTASSCTTLRLSELSRDQGCPWTAVHVRDVVERGCLSGCGRPPAKVKQAGSGGATQGDESRMQGDADGRAECQENCISSMRL